MKTLRNIRRRSSGQSVTEFALMMPVIMAFFFYVFEANIHMSAMQQGSYASYAAARGFLVKHDGKGEPSTFKGKILTGTIWNTANIAQDGQDGVKVTFGNFASLPYSRQLLDFNNEIPTHLGKNEWSSPWTSQRESHGTGLRLTDNNLTDN
jgi:hypothetical protein